MFSQSSLEPLETRIAPAQLFFVQSNATTILTSAGANAQDTTAESDAAIFAGANSAVLMAAGDRLIFDANSDHILNAGDVELLRINGGKAMVFFTDGLGAQAGEFDADELTGLAVGTGFNATIKTDIRGSVITALTATNTLSVLSGNLQVQHGASITGLSVTGKMGASLAGSAQLLAGGAISNVTFTNDGVLDIDGGVSTGSKANFQLATLNGGAKTFFTGFTVGAGERGGDIVNLKLPNGSRGIGAGDGGAGAAGGSIRTVSVLDGKAPMSVVAGNGGDGSGLQAGGAGGSLVGVSVKTVALTSNEISFRAGSGGAAVAGTGGAGGAISGLTVDVSSEVVGFKIQGGDGGDSTGGRGGAGGAVLRSTLTLGLSTQSTIISGGDGGDAGGKSAGGAGGALSIVTYTVDGASGSGGLSVSGGKGGNGGANGGAGGAGGALGSVKGTVTDKVDVSLSVKGGRGGDGGSTLGIGGAGGALSTVSLTLNDAGAVVVSGGFGGSGHSAKGGAGGAATAVTVQNLAAVTSLQISSGAGGDATSGNGSGGNAGAASTITYTNTGGVQTFALLAERGGSASGTGSGGLGGALSRVVATMAGDVATQGYISSGAGGNADTAGNGGSAGALSSLRFTDSKAGGVAGAISVVGAKGGDSAGLTGIGGNGGAVSSVIFNAPLTTIAVGTVPAASVPSSSGGQGGSGPTARGGSGGGISSLSGTVGEISIVAGDGGNATAGRGGLGGSVVSAILKNPGNLAVARLIAAGDGGDGAVARGGGGSVSSVNLAGDIGIFGIPFDTSLDGTGMGGLIAGQAGTGGGTAVNGSVRTVTALRIASIVAGHPLPNAISNSNAVYLITGVKATSTAAGSKIGADVNGNAAFDFTDIGAVGFVPGTGDTALDGIVIVRTAGSSAASFSGTVPLKLVKV